MSEQYAKYTCLVYPKNRHSGYGETVVVIATSRQGAINRAVDIGWSGYDDDARVKITLVEDMGPCGLCSNGDTPEKHELLTNP